MTEEKAIKVEPEELKETPKRVPKKAELSPEFIAAKQRDLEIEVAKRRGGLK